MSILFQRSFAAVATGFVMLASAQSHADSVPGKPQNPAAIDVTLLPGQKAGFPQNSGSPGYGPGYGPYVPVQTQRPPPGLFGRLPQTPNCLGCGFGLRLQQMNQPQTYTRVHLCRPSDRIIVGSGLCAGP
jgi:hypothetical protein